MTIVGCAKVKLSSLSPIIINQEASELNGCCIDVYGPLEGVPICGYFYETPEYSGLFGFVEYIDSKLLVGSQGEGGGFDAEVS